MRVERVVKAARAGSASPARKRCGVCSRFARVLVAGGRCEPCAGVLPLDFTPQRRSEDRAALARECAELGEHDWDAGGVQPCPCGRPHPFRICARCLTPDIGECEVSR